MAVNICNRQNNKRRFAAAQRVYNARVHAFETRVGAREMQRACFGALSKVGCVNEMKTCLLFPLGKKRISLLIYEL